MINSQIMNELHKNNYVTTASVQRLGFSKQLLTKYVKQGKLQRLSRGIYALPCTFDDDMFYLIYGKNYCIFSHESALYLNGLSERTPFRFTITIPNNSSVTRKVREQCHCFYIKPELFSLGLIEVKTIFGNKVKCYNLERTICDLVRSRNKIDRETLVLALQKYVNYEKRDLITLLDYAKKLGVNAILKTYLEVLL